MDKHWMLIHANDAPGIWLYNRLRQQGIAVELVTVEEWFCNRSFTLTMDTDTARASLQLQDGRRWESEQTRAVLARVCSLPDLIWQLFADTEKDYVAQEWQAIFVAWTEMLPMLLNRPTPMGLSGRNRSAGEWSQLAHAAGFDTVSIFYDSDPESAPTAAPTYPLATDLLVYRGRCYGPPSLISADVKEIACRFQEMSGESLLGVTLAWSATGGQFISATTHPDLRLGGDVFIHDISTYLQNGTALWSAERFAPAIAG